LYAIWNCVVYFIKLHCLNKLQKKKLLSLTMPETNGQFPNNMVTNI